MWKINVLPSHSHAPGSHLMPWEPLGTLESPWCHGDATTVVKIKTRVVMNQTQNACNLKLIDNLQLEYFYAFRCGQSF